MINTLIFDTDGIFIHRDMYFSQKLSEERNIPIETILPFFKCEYKLCLEGKSDLKLELTKYIDKWKWTDSVDDLVEYWFSNERRIDNKMLKHISKLRKKGIKCYLETNNEKYRTKDIFDNLNLKKHFDNVFSSAHLGYSKPNHKFWSSIHDSIGKPNKNEVLVWDDDKENVMSAKDFGFNAMFYTAFDEYKNHIKSLNII